MTRSIRRLPPSSLPLINLRTGRMEPTWYKYFLDINRDLGGDGKNAITAVDNRLTTEVEVIGNNLNQVTDAAGAGGALVATFTPAQLTESRIGAGLVTTPVLNITATGGAGGYTYATTLKSGDTLTIINGTTSTPSFSANLEVNEIREAVYQTVITSGADTYTIEYTVIVLSFSDGGFG